MHVMMTMMQRQGNQEASSSLEGPRRAESGDRRAGHRVPGAEVGRWDERWWEGEGERERGREVRLAQAEGLPPTVYCMYL